jgi:hypothetical protein
LIFLKKWRKGSVLSNLRNISDLWLNSKEKKRQKFSFAQVLDKISALHSNNSPECGNALSKTMKLISRKQDARFR